MKQNEIFFPWDIFKSDTISFLLNYMKVFQSILKLKVLSFMIRVNSKHFK